MGSLQRAFDVHRAWAHVPLTIVQTIRATCKAVPHLGGPELAAAAEGDCGVLHCDGEGGGNCTLRDAQHGGDGHFDARSQCLGDLGAMFGAWPLETAGVVMEYPRAPKRKRGGSWLARLFSR